MRQRRRLSEPGRRLRQDHVQVRPRIEMRPEQFPDWKPRSQFKNLERFVSPNHRQLVQSIPRLSAPSCHLLGKINTIGTLFSTRQHNRIFFDHYQNHRCHIEKNVHILFILPSRLMVLRVNKLSMAWSAQLSFMNYCLYYFAIFIGRPLIDRKACWPKKMMVDQKLFFSKNNTFCME